MMNTHPKAQPIIFYKIKSTPIFWGATFLLSAHSAPEGTAMRKNYLLFHRLNKR